MHNLNVWTIIEYKGMKTVGSYRLHKPVTPYAFQMETRTHSKACHRKSPRSRRYLMVFDPLTPSQGHQFDPRVKLFNGLLLIPFNLICHMTMFSKLNFLPPSTPKSQTLGHAWRRGPNENPNMFYIFHLWEDTQFSWKIFENDFVIEI